MQKKAVAVVVTVTWDDGSKEKMTWAEFNAFVDDDLRRSGWQDKILEEAYQKLDEAFGLHRLRNVTHLPPEPGPN
ncbi:MAG: hypothetical protein HY372_02180 [Candidatus Andersenbacteria bacterium]|nr:hypothetical protein [Candidatus Andersenbacteria bacterium]